ncbi:MAG: putative toxin-antitoxin system toxin component, PIN family [Thermomicrobiales bacterium]
MISAVLDTNVLVSGLIGADKPSSTPGELIRRWRDGSYQLVVSEHLLGELAVTLTDPWFASRLSAETIAETLDTLQADAVMQAVTVSVSGVASHPEDDVVIATALSARSLYLVTGDKQLLVRTAYRGTSFITPRQFLEVLDSESRR